MYTVVVQEISTIFTDQMPNFHVSRKVHSMLVSEFSTFYHVVSKFLRNKRQISK